MYEVGIEFTIYKNTLYATEFLIYFDSEIKGEHHCLHGAHRFYLTDVTIIARFVELRVNTTCAQYNVPLARN